MSSKRTLKIIGAGIAVLLLFVITMLAGPPVAVCWVHVPAFEGRIRAPEKFVFEGYEIEVSWRCFKTNPFLGFVQTYSACGRDADGSLTIEVGTDGRFQFPRLLQWHVNFFTDNEYVLSGGIRDRQGAVNVFRFYYDERRNRLVPELNSVRLIVIQPARIKARTFARRGADVIPFADVAQWFPQHGTLHHALALEADIRGGERVDTA